MNSQVCCEASLCSGCTVMFRWYPLLAKKGGCTRSIVVSEFSEGKE
jgi:hypothetical protein